MPTPNPFIEKAKKKSQQRALMMNHLSALEGIQKRYQKDPGPGAERIDARVEECKEILRKM